MEVRFWGVRGSIAKAGPSTARYGGNTSCIEVRSVSGTVVVLDCGTGAHGLGVDLMKRNPRPTRGYLLISHTHWDHIQGIPFFAPLFVPGNVWDIHAPAGLGQSLRDTLAGQMQYTYFPITIEQLGATIRYHDLVEGTFQMGDITVTARYLNHPALTLGYRLEADGCSVVYACDHEPHARSLADGTGEIRGQDEQHAAFLKDADLVIHDAQYTATEYANKIGWGHSTSEYAVSVCRRAGAKRLALTHHDPLRDDDAVDAVIEKVRGLAGQALEVFGAAEGTTIAIPASVQAINLEKPAETALSSAPPGLQDRSVFIGMTDADAIGLISDAARSDSFSVSQATKIDSLASEAKATEPTLVVLEDAPTMDAVHIAGAVRRHDEWGRNVPIIVIAARDEPEQTGEAGINEWIVRPFSREYARSRMRAWSLRAGLRWRRAPRPTNETMRLSSLHNLEVLDTPREERFDRITRLASAALEVPISVVSLVDHDRQWFKSCIGLDASETPRDAAFCAHAILKPDVLIVPDTLLDDRFADNPLVINEPRIRFYAGCPLVLADGMAVGTLCCIDTRPRQLDPTKIQILRDLAKFAERELQSAKN